MKLISNPISDKMRALGMAKLLYIYGGVSIPISFLCIRNIEPMYSKGVTGDKPFVCENIDRNITSTTYSFYPNMSFMGAPRKNELINQLVEFMQRAISNDFTAESVFIGEFDRWIESRVREGKMNTVSGSLLGVKDKQGNAITVDELMSNTPIKMAKDIYGIWIPSQEILKRRKFEWFARMSVSQILSANTILSKYIIMANIVDENGGIITELKANPDWVSFWSVPSQAPVWGLKPDLLGNNVIQLEEPSYAGN
jgi:hypothetical protein